MVGGNAQLAAGLELGGNKIERTIAGIRRWRGAPLPRVGVEQVNEAQVPLGSGRKTSSAHRPCGADVGNALVANVAERGGDRLEERPAADEAVIG